MTSLADDSPATTDIYYELRMRASHLSGSFRFNMAPVGERNDRMGSVGEDEDPESQNLWYFIF